MNALLTRLGVPPGIQAFFNLSTELSFDYGDDIEHFDEGIYKVPTTRNLWVAGTVAASNVIISYSAVEIIAFLTINRQRYPKLEELAFVAIGNRLFAEQANWISQNFPGRRFTLIFGKDLLGHITDIKLAASLTNMDIRVFHANHKVMIYRGEQFKIFEDRKLSLHLFKMAFGIRNRILTRKPAQSLTFLNQLKNDTQR